MDPNFTVDQICFSPKEFTQAYLAAAPGSVLVWDETELGVGAREFMSSVNRATVGFLQSSRFLEVSCLFTLPLSGLMDTQAVRVSKFLVRLLNRGYARIHEIKPNQTGRNPPVRTPTIGDVHVGKASERMWQAYLDKRKLFHSRFFSIDKFEDEETKLLQTTGGRERWAKVLENPKPYLDRYGKIDVKTLQRDFEVSPSTSYNWKEIIEKRLAETGS